MKRSSTRLDRPTRHSSRISARMNARAEGELERRLPTWPIASPLQFWVGDLVESDQSATLFVPQREVQRSNAADHVQRRYLPERRRCLVAFLQPVVRHPWIQVM